MKKRIKEVLIMLSLALSAAWLGICIFYVVKDHEAYSSTIEYRGHSYIISTLTGQVRQLTIPTARAIRKM